MRKRCTKTLSGKHLFMPMEWVETGLAKVFEIHGVKNPQKCVACGIIDDTNNNEE